LRLAVTLVDVSTPDAQSYEDDTDERPLPIGLAAASLIFGVLAVLSAAAGAGVVGIIAVVLGHLARGKIRAGTGRGDGLAIAGLVLGYIGILTAAVASINAT
jgi:hypothetical protein